MKRDKPISKSGAAAAGISQATSARVPAAVLIALASFAAFVPALGNEFVNWDDYETLVENSRYRGLGWPQLRWMFTTFHMGHFQPLSWLSFALDYLVWETNPVGYHLTNLILHALNAVVFFFLARLLLACTVKAVDARQVGLTLGAAAAALLFSIHPLRVESVVWATERRDVLSGLFYLLALHQYVVAQTRAQVSPSRRLLAASVLFYALSLLSKATAMTLPAVLVLLDVYPLRRLPGNLSAWTKREYRLIFLEKLPFVALAVLFALIAVFAQQDTGALRPMQQYFISYRVAQVFYAVCFYLWKSIAPFGLSPLYELPFDFDTWMPLFLLSAAAVVTITITFYRLRERWPAPFAAWMYYLITLAPVAGIAQSGPQLVADRYSYLSCLSWALLFGGGFAGLWIFLQHDRARHRWTLAASSATGLVLFLVLGFLTWQQSKVWRDTATLWRHVIAATPNSSIAHYNLGRLYETEGQLDASLEHYQRAVQNNPANAEAQYNLARLLARRGMETEAITRYRLVVNLRPNDVDARNNLGLLLARRGDAEAAVEQFRKATEIDPSYAKAFFNIGRVLAARGDLEPAIDNYRQALKFNPDQTEILLGLADALARQGRAEEATALLRKAVALRPESAEGHTALARLLALQGRNAEAESHYKEALQLLKSQSASPPGRGAP